MVLTRSPHSPATTDQFTSHAPFDVRVATIASTQFGLITLDQLRGLGLTTSGVMKRLRAGRLHRVQPRVYAVGHTALSFDATTTAVLLSIGPDAVASGRCAAHLTKCFTRGRHFVEVTSTRRHRGLADAVVRFTRCLPETERRTFNGLAMTTQARIVVDLAEHLTEYQVAHAIHESRRLKLLRLDELDAAARTHRHRHGHPILVDAIRLHRAGSAGTRSFAEDDFLRMLLATTFAVPQVNVHVTVGRRKYEVDFCWPELRLCVEVDGPEHELPARRRKDELRDAQLRRHGFEVIRVPVAFLDAGFERVVHRLATSGM